MKRAFTLVELLVVIAIIGILASIVTVSLSSTQIRARDTKRIAEVRQLALLVRSYIIANNTIPNEVAGCDRSYGSGDPCPTTPGTNWNSSVGLSAALVPNFASSLPVDPINNTTYYYGYEPNHITGSRNGCVWAILERGGYFRVGLPFESSTYDSPCSLGVEITM